MYINHLAFTIILKQEFIFFPLNISDEICLGDTSRKFGPMTPRHTIDAILGLKNCEKLLDGN